MHEKKKHIFSIVAGFVLLLISCNSNHEKKSKQEKIIAAQRIKKEAEDWLKEHEEKCLENDVGSCFKVGHYWRGDTSFGNAKTDMEKARKYFHKACHSEDKTYSARLAACYWLAHMKRMGDGGPKNLEESLVLFRDVCDQGYGMGCAELGLEFYKRDNDLKKGRELFKEACEKDAYLACPDGRLNSESRDTERYRLFEILQGNKEPSDKPHELSKNPTE